MTLKTLVISCFKNIFSVSTCVEPPEIFSDVVWPQPTENCRNQTIFMEILKGNLSLKIMKSNDFF